MSETGATATSSSSSIEGALTISPYAPATQRAVLAQNPRARIGLLGLAYKQDTHSIKNSPAVALVDGDPDNIKITTATDLTRMQTLLGLTQETRTGMGYDVHQLKAHDPDTPVSQQHIKLCGVRIPFAYRLVGHSDADVGLHALTDAILGAIGAGDIGMHFPPSDPQWKGASSDGFLAHAVGLVRARGGSIAALDVTIICERPRIGPHRAAMVERVAAIVGLAPDRVSVKATTTEKLGFTGRGEGIAAQAVATVRLPL